jgi:hypothetical protein
MSTAGVNDRGYGADCVSVWWMSRVVVAAV